MKLKIRTSRTGHVRWRSAFDRNRFSMPLAPLGQFQSSNVESVAVVCGPRGCVRTRPVYRRGAYVVRRPYVRRGYGYHRGYRRY